MSHCCLPSKWKIPQCCRHPQAATHSGTEYTSNEHTHTHTHTHTCTHQANEGGRLPWAQWGVCRVSWRGSHFDRNGSMDLDQCTELLCPLSWQCTTGGRHIRTDTGGWQQVGWWAVCPSPSPVHAPPTQLHVHYLRKGCRQERTVTTMSWLREVRRSVLLPTGLGALRVRKATHAVMNCSCGGGKRPLLTDTQHLVLQYLSHRRTHAHTDAHMHTRVHVRGVP